MRLNLFQVLICICLRVQAEHNTAAVPMSNDLGFNWIRVAILLCQKTGPHEFQYGEQACTVGLSNSSADLSYLLHLLDESIDSPVFHLAVIQLITVPANVLKHGKLPADESDEQIKYYLFYGLGATNTSKAVVSYQLIQGDAIGKDQQRAQVVGVGFNHTLGSLELKVRFEVDVRRSWPELIKSFLESGRLMHMLSDDNEHNALIDTFFEELLSHLPKPLKVALETETTLTINDIHQVILHGGATRNSRVQQTIKQLMKQNFLIKTHQQKKLLTLKGDKRKNKFYVEYDELQRNGKKQKGALGSAYNMRVNLLGRSNNFEFETLFVLNDAGILTYMYVESSNPEYEPKNEDVQSEGTAISIKPKGNKQDEAQEAIFKMAQAKLQVFERLKQTFQKRINETLNYGDAKLKSRPDTALKSLESHIVEVQIKLTDWKYASCATYKETRILIYICKTLTAWLHEDRMNTSTELYELKLAHLQHYSNKFQTRYLEHKERPLALRHLIGMIWTAEKFVKSAMKYTKENYGENYLYTHEEINRLLLTIWRISNWLYFENSMQLQRRRSEEVILTVEKLTDKMIWLMHEMKLMSDKLKLWAAKLKAELAQKSKEVQPAIVKANKEQANKKIPKLSFSG